jgi:hypothetical protein
MEPFKDLGYNTAIRLQGSSSPGAYSTFGALVESYDLVLPRQDT